MNVRGIDFSFDSLTRVTPRIRLTIFTYLPFSDMCKFQFEFHRVIKHIVVKLFDIRSKHCTLNRDL